MEVACFTFNAFQENTYLLYDDTKQCVIFDPGCSTPDEQKQLSDFIESKGLTPVKLINTHCHIDHVLGNKFVAEKYGLALEAHKDEKPVLESGVMVSQMYGIPYSKSPDIAHFIEEGDIVRFGNTQLKAIFTPGHSPASLSFFHEESKQLIAGDVLFRMSIGRTDLPGGNYDTLIQSIKQKLLPLGDEVIVYPGHMTSTTIGFERKNNPFLKS